MSPLFRAPLVPHVPFLLRPLRCVVLVRALCFGCAPHGSTARSVQAPARPAMGHPLHSRLAKPYVWDGCLAWAPLLRWPYTLEDPWRRVLALPRMHYHEPYPLAPFLLSLTSPLFELSTAAPPAECAP